MCERVASEHLGQGMEGASGGYLADPSGFVIDRARIDARGCEKLTYGSLPALGACAQEVCFQDRCA
jgi:hypothetical protein